MHKPDLVPIIASQLRRYPRLVALLKSVSQTISPGAALFLDYPIVLSQRWKTPHYNTLIYEIINERRDFFASQLQTFLSLTRHLTSIPVRQIGHSASSEPCWINGWMPALDGVALYSFIATHNPSIYLEIGSGNSTKFARKAIADHHLNTEIVSIDPHPRAEVDDICDEIIRKPVEEVDLQIFDRLGRDDILYIDGSHRVFMNSDATIVFLDILPKLKSGVLVEIHDIMLPYDYPNDWIDRYYSEQYLLAAYILAKGNMFDIVLPNTFISMDDELRRTLAPLWEKEEMKNVETHGCSFWIRIK